MYEYSSNYFYYIFFVFNNLMNYEYDTTNIIHKIYVSESILYHFYKFFRFINKYIVNWFYFYIQIIKLIKKNYWKVKLIELN